MFRQFVRQFATRNLPGNPVSTALKDPVRQVFISQSNDVFTNLALEDWLYRHHDFAHKVRKLVLCWTLKSTFFALCSICYCYGETIHVL